MPSFLDFNSTKSFRDKILGRTLQQPNGPQTFSDTSYREQNLSDIPNISLGNVDTNRTSDLKSIQTINLYKPESFFIEENIDTLPRRANLSLYPYFTTGDYNLFGIMNTKSYDTESELFKFAAYNIRNNTQGPVYSRIAQNVEKTTLGRVRILDALNGNSAAALNIITGREPLVESNYSITINPANPSGVPVDFLTAVEGADNFPTSIIPGDYLSNPQNPLNYNSQNPLQLGTLLNDATGVLASMVGIQGKPKISPRPSDILIEYMGQGQKNRLFDLLSYSRYSPNYTLLSEVNNVLQNGLQIKSPIQVPGNTYIGDDRYFDVKYSMSDFWDRTVRGNYYTSLMFDSGSAELFHKSKNYSEGGPIGGNLTWYSKGSKNPLGANNKSYSDNSSDFESKLSTKFEYRRDSILGNTQELLNSLPSDGGISRSHVANVIDQTSRVFQEGDVKISRGSAIKYTDKFGQESGVEYCRVWTKDRPYLHLSDTMKKTDTIRKYDGSVLGGRGRVWNTSIAPMSNGKKSFDNSSNIANGYQYGGGFYAKKYMFSIENLAWKTSNKDGFRVSDLPVCEKGPNGGRVMWFPPYDLKVSEQNSARWEENSFLGRPEPIYTYQNASRSGQVSFKVVVDHPSILNLLTREYFKDMSDEESDNYINAFFAGCQDLDFYSLIQTYTTLDTNDVSNIQSYLNAGTPKDVIQQYKYTSTDVKINKPNSSPEVSTSVNIPDFNGQLFFMNDRPTVGKSKGTTNELYTATENEYFGLKNKYSTDLLSDLQKLAVDGTPEAKKDRKTIFNTESTLPSGTSVQTITLQVNKINEAFTSLDKNSNDFYNQCQEIKKALSGETIQEVSVTIFTSASEVADDTYNFYLGVRRAYSIINDMFENIKNDKKPKIQWFEDVDLKKYFKSGLTTKDTYKEYKFQDFGWKTEGVLKVSYITKGENTALSTANPAPGSQDNINCHTPIYTKYGLKNTAPIAFYCRQASVNIKVTKKEEQPKPTKTGGSSTIPKITVSPDTPITTYNKKPPIDVMKRIIMKTLSECFYFKQLEDNSPVTFKSLKEKLKYFHPGFHSTTPEGLNSRLTFLLQCLRPGDTIPIKGLADNTDLNSRNTSFGPPPICVIRIGDFYHSKIIIRDVNISYEDGPWDMNPEGIGYQPMIANITLQVSFIGGQGLEKPVEKLQNALSSNFFANTEMYDERSESTATTIAGKKTSDFTKEFLESLVLKARVDLNSTVNDPDSNISLGVYIGKLSDKTLDYTSLIDNLSTNITAYFSSYNDVFNVLKKKYSSTMVPFLLSPYIRTITGCVVETPQSVSGATTINLLGEYKPGNEIGMLMDKFKITYDNLVNNTDINKLLGLDEIINSDYKTSSNEEIRKYIITISNNIFDEIKITKVINKLESAKIKLISNIDKLNYIVKYSGDSQIHGVTATKATLSGYTNTDFYNMYKSQIDWLISQHGRLTITVGPTTQSSYDNFDSLLLKFVLQVFLYGKETDIVNLYGGVGVFIDDNGDGVSAIKAQITEILKSFTYQPTDDIIALDKFPVKSNNKPVKYTILSTADVTDDTEKDVIRKIFRDKNNLQNNLLNFYKPNATANE